MSRLGKIPIKLPEGVRAELLGNELSLTGPLGTTTLSITKVIVPTSEDSQIIVNRKDDTHMAKAQHGLWQRLISNAVVGVKEGYVRRIEIKGVGMRATLEGDALTLSLGFSHPVQYVAPAGVTLKMEKNTIVISSLDKQKVGEVAASIRRLRPVEPYKGKGLRYSNERVILKPGKAGKGAAGKGA